VSRRRKRARRSINHFAFLAFMSRALIKIFSIFVLDFFEKTWVFWTYSEDCWEIEEVCRREISSSFVDEEKLEDATMT
jgi:hypothetical protein